MMKAYIISDRNTSLFPSASAWDTRWCPLEIGQCQLDPQLWAKKEKKKALNDLFSDKGGLFQQALRPPGIKHQENRLKDT